MLRYPCKENFTSKGDNMEKEEILKKSQKEKPALVGEMEVQKTNKGNWIALITAGVVAVVFMIIEGALGHYTSIFALASVCYAWASILYFCQYFLAKRPWQVLIGGVLHGLAFCTMIALYIISNIQAW